jgi:D-glycero-D-manno-heptose 1,7-bisphosphate phosphatase
MGINPLKSRRAVFLDRDGVLNRVFLHCDGKTHPPATPEEMEILPGVKEACLALRRAGFLQIVVTNQPDVARGTQTRKVVEAINDMLRSQVLVDEIFVCYHDDADKCTCRKPKPGLLLEAAHEFDLNLTNSFLVGDRWSDIEAGQRVGCKTILVEGPTSEAHRVKPDFHTASLKEAVALILGTTRKAAGGMF